MNNSCFLNLDLSGMLREIKPMMLKETPIQRSRSQYPSYLIKPHTQVSQDNLHLSGEPISDLPCTLNHESILT